MPRGSVLDGIVRVPVIPPPGTVVAVMVPEPLAAKVAPVFTTIAAVVLVPDVIEENAADPVPHGAPASTALPLASHLTQLFALSVPVVSTTLEPVP